MNFGDDGNSFGGRGFFGAPSRPPAGDAPLKDDARAKEQVERLKTIGYVGRPGAVKNRGLMPDLTHINAVAYNAELDQIMLSPRYYSEFWVIDHGTTPAEAAGHEGGLRGQGRRPVVPLGEPPRLSGRHRG